METCPCRTTSGQPSGSASTSSGGADFGLGGRATGDFVGLQWMLVGSVDGVGKGWQHPPHRELGVLSDVIATREQEMEHTAESALKRLKEGNERFCQDKGEGRHRDATRRQDLQKGQQPFAVVVTCADSRVVPELAFDVGLGEIFGIQVAGNIPNASTIASIEYAVLHLKTKLVMVLAHENCGAVTAAMEGGDAGKNLNHLLKFIEPAVLAPGEKDVNSVSRRNARNTADALVRESDIIGRGVSQDGVQIVTAFYNLGSGKVEFN